MFRLATPSSASASISLSSSAIAATTPVRSHHARHCLHTAARSRSSVVISHGQLPRRPRCEATLRHGPALCRRQLTTAAPARKRRSLKNMLARLALAGGVVYFYNVSDVFAEGGEVEIHRSPQREHADEELPTLEELAAERRKRSEAQAAAEARKREQKESQSSSADNKRRESSGSSNKTGDASSEPSSESAPQQKPGDAVEELEEEADQQGAFDPETGIINWDCPCLGGMAHGPCGEEFKEAFSCFVYSKEEPKGADCIEKFKGMQECFREHPDVYNNEFDDDEDEEGELAGQEQPAMTEDAPSEGREVASKPAARSEPAKRSERPSSESTSESESKESGEIDQKRDPESRAAEIVAKGQAPGVGTTLPSHVGSNPS